MISPHIEISGDLRAARGRMRAREACARRAGTLPQWLGASSIKNIELDRTIISGTLPLALSANPEASPHCATHSPPRLTNYLL